MWNDNIPSSLDKTSNIQSQQQQYQRRRRRKTEITTTTTIIPILITFIITCHISITSAAHLNESSSSEQHSLTSSPYRIIIDGGSTGSRLHLFQFLTSPTHPTRIERRGSWKAPIPLSSFAPLPSSPTLDPIEVSSHLHPLLAHAARLIPDAYRATTGVTFGATAGMRLLTPKDQEAVYDAVYDGLPSGDWGEFGGTFPFSGMKRGDVVTLDGDAEGFFGMMAANYLSGAMDGSLRLVVTDEEEEVVGALDMGGSSTQIVYRRDDNNRTSRREGSCRVLSPETEEESTTCRNNETLDKDDYVSISHLSYGVDPFRERVWDALIHSHEATNSNTTTDVTTIANPCGFRNHITSYKNHTLHGTGQSHHCSTLIRQLLPGYTTPQQQPRVVNQMTHAIPPRGSFYAMSNYFFSLDALRTLSVGGEMAQSVLNEAWPRPTIEELEGALDGFCSREWSEDLELIQHRAHRYTSPEILPHRCLESVYIVNLLRHGFGFDPTVRDITYAYDVKGSEVEWTLGMALWLEGQQRSDGEGEEVLIDKNERLLERVEEERSCAFDGTADMGR